MSVRSVPTGNISIRGQTTYKGKCERRYYFCLLETDMAPGTSEFTIRTRTRTTLNYAMYSHKGLRALLAGASEEAAQLDIGNVSPRLCSCIPFVAHTFTSRCPGFKSRRFEQMLVFPCWRDVHKAEMVMWSCAERRGRRHSLALDAWSETPSVRLSSLYHSSSHTFYLGSQFPLY